MVFLNSTAVAHTVTELQSAGESSEEASRMAYQVLYTTSSQQLALAFINRADYEDWSTEVEGRKREMAEFNRTAGMTESGRKRWCRSWARRVIAIKENWGDAKVPDDLRSALHDVQDYLGMERTAFI